MSVWIIVYIILLLNIPFGYWRENTRKFSFHWFFAIHFPVFIGIILRYKLGIEFKWITLPLFITAFFTGQLIGSRIRRYQKRKQIKNNLTQMMDNY